MADLRYRIFEILGAFREPMPGFAALNPTCEDYNNALRSTLTPASRDSSSVPGAPVVRVLR